MGWEGSRTGQGGGIDWCSDAGCARVGWVGVQAQAWSSGDRCCGSCRDASWLSLIQKGCPTRLPPQPKTSAAPAHALLTCFGEVVAAHIHPSHFHLAAARAAATTAAAAGSSAAARAAALAGTAVS